MVFENTAKGCCIGEKPIVFRVVVNVQRAVVRSSEVVINGVTMVGVMGGSYGERVVDDANFVTDFKSDGAKVGNANVKVAGLTEGGLRDIGENFVEEEIIY